MRYLVKAIFLLIVFIIQSTLVQYIGIFGIVPNVLLAAIIAVSLSSETIEGACLAALCGVVFDLMFGRVFGMSTLLYTYVALLSRALLELMYEKTVVSTMLITFVGTLIYQCVTFFFSFAIWGEGSFWFLFFRAMLPTAVYTGITQVAIYFINEKLPFIDGVRGART